jgi:hypothetical protein
MVGLLTRRLDAVHGLMLLPVGLLLVAIAAAAVPLTAVGVLLVVLRRLLVWAAAWQPTRSRKAVAS